MHLLSCPGFILLFPSAEGPQEERRDDSSSVSDSDLDSDDSDGDAEKNNRKTAHDRLFSSKGKRKPSWALKRGHRKKRRR